jgi:hypothetical protein
MKKLIIISIIFAAISASAMPGEPSMNEPNWNFPSQDPSLTANIKFTVPLRHETRHMSLADVIKKNSKEEFKTVVSDKVVKQILASFK